MVLFISHYLPLEDQIALSGACASLRKLLQRTVLNGWRELMAASKDTARARIERRARISSPREPMTCCIRCIGGPRCGKTTTIIVYTTNAVPQDYIPSVFDEYTVNVMVDGRPVYATLCDTPSHVDLEELIKWKSTDLFMAFCDRTRASSAGEMKRQQRWARVRGLLSAC